VTLKRPYAHLGQTTLAGLLCVCGFYGWSRAQEIPGSSKIHPVILADVSTARPQSIPAPGTAAQAALAQSVTAERVKNLPAAEQESWQRYLERSEAAARADRAALEKEVADQHLSAPLQAPNGGDFKLPAEAGDPWYSGEEASKLADTILSYQTPSGGWSKHTGYSYGPRKPGMQWTSQNKPGESAHYLATFDNRSTTEQLQFLAYVWHATKREDCKAAFVRGLDYILAAQYPNGGWPQVYPLEGGYHDHITFNDDAMTRVVKLLKEIEGGEPYYAFLTDSQRAKAIAAMQSGVRCILKLQIEQAGKKTVWCAQYDPLTEQPSQARKMEPASLSGGESARILELLMSFNSPTPQVTSCIESGLAWFETVKLPPAPGTATGADDKPAAGARWARFYDLETGKPIFPGRDGVLYNTFEAMAENNRLGYDYFSTKPGSLLNSGQKKWRKMLERNKKGLL
jgi:PelA/Pel-15E family pectate lyase